MKAKPLEDETINYVNDNGFTPFLFYINEFGNIYQDLLRTVQNMHKDNLIKINNENIIDQYLTVYKNKNV